MVGIIDYDMGNLFSILKASQKVGLKSEIVDINSEFDKYDALILPGVGAFGDAMTVIEETGMRERIINYANSGRYILGICLGMQLLVEKSFELGDHRGLGLIKGTCRSFRSVSPKVITPQIMWNNLLLNNSNANTGLIYQGITHNEMVYFVHSYFVELEDQTNVLSETVYQNIRYCSSFQRDNIIGIQFHPEKSGKTGLKIYENFKKIIKEDR